MGDKIYADKISLIVPVYNMSQFLARCMGSLFNQQGAFEIILVDDGSTDESSVLCDHYASEHPDMVRVIHKQNGGLSSARNAGMEAAQGEYVIFPDPDDWLEPNYVQRLAELQEQYQPDLLCVGYFVDYDDRSIPANEGQIFRRMNGLEAQRALLLPPCMSGFAWNKLYHLDMIREHGLQFLDDVGTTEDLDFAFRYLQYCKMVVFSPEDRLYHYYQRSGAATHGGFSQKQMAAIHTYEKIIQASSDAEIICAAKEEICNTAVNLLWAYQNSGTNDKKPKRQIQQYIGKYLSEYCHSRQFGTGRKVQAVMAHYAPGLYAVLKKRVTREM